MPATLTGVSTTDPTTSPTLSAPASGDAVASSAMQTALQALLNAVSWLRTKAARLDNGGAAITNVGTPTNAGDVATKGYVDAVGNYCSGRVDSGGNVTVHAGSQVTPTASRTGTGTYRVNVSMTVNCVVHVTTNMGGQPRVFDLNANATGFTVYFFDATTHAAVDTQFMFSVVGA